MPTLHVRNVPERLHRKIRSLATDSNRSLSAEVVELLDRGVHDAELRRAQKGLLTDIRRNRFKPPKGTPESQILVREDRER
jgi:plasmid stability protein